MARTALIPVWVRYRLALALTLGLAAGLGGCASGAIVDHLPASMGGEPTDLPAKPAVAYQYPAVHDMPPARADTPMSDTEQVRMEKELQSARDRQEGLYGTAPTSAAAPKKKPGTAKSDQTSGATANP
jgi:hypothetical protein